MIADFGGFIKHNCHGDDAESVRKKKHNTQARRRFLDQNSEKHIKKVIKGEFSN